MLHRVQIQNYARQKRSLISACCWPFIPAFPARECLDVKPDASVFPRQGKVFTCKTFVPKWTEVFFLRVRQIVFILINNRKRRAV